MKWFDENEDTSEIFKNDMDKKSPVPDKVDGLFPSDEDIEKMFPSNYTDDGTYLENMNKQEGANWMKELWRKSTQQSDAVEDRINAFIEQFLQDPYPEDVFLPISKQELTDIHEMLLREFKMPLDRLTGHIGRLLRKPLSEEAKKILSKQ